MKTNGARKSKLVIDRSPLAAWEKELMAQAKKSLSRKKKKPALTLDKPKAKTA
jgi:hypothetical protein